MTEQQITTAIKDYLRYTGHRSIHITAALIDCDGVLFDSMKNHTRAWVKLMTKNGVKCTRDEFYQLEGMTGTDIIKTKFKSGLGRQVTDDEARALYKVKGRYFQELGEVPVMPGIKRVLDTLATLNITRVLVTGSQQPSILERIDREFPNAFGPYRVTGDDVSRGKPNPEPYLKGMAKVEARSNQCIVLENAPLGVQAGHAAGCFTIGVTTGPIAERDLLKAGADVVFANMDALAEALPLLIERLNTSQAQ